ncbi:MAG TPA: hypothetical protein K8V79_10895, partial [Acinetobacter lwoffii]|nr:hypothetical protein [Acinetobacter lwoffii]
PSISSLQKNENGELAASGRIVILWQDKTTLILPVKKFWCSKNSIRLCRYHQYINQGQFKWLYRIEDYVDLNNPNSWGLAKHTSRAGVRYVLGLILKEWSNKLLQPVHNVGPETEKMISISLSFFLSRQLPTMV